MIGYVTLGANDLETARTFYSQVLGLMGAGEIMRMPNGYTMYGTDFGTKPALAVTHPHNQEPATYGNGTMISLQADSRDQVDAVYGKALELGGSCEGKPGLRGDEGPQAFYAAYFRDPEGNKLCAFRIGGA